MAPIRISIDSPLCHSATTASEGWRLAIALVCPCPTNSAHQATDYRTILRAGLRSGGFDAPEAHRRGKEVLEVWCSRGIGVLPPYSRGTMLWGHAVPGFGGVVFGGHCLAEAGFRKISVPRACPGRGTTSTRTEDAKIREGAARAVRQRLKARLLLGPLPTSAPDGFTVHCHPQAVQEAVQSSFSTIPLDNVVPEGMHHSIKIYGLLHGEAFGDLENQTYKVGFSCLLQRRYDEASAQFTQYCEHPKAMGEVLTQAHRLLQV